MGTLRKVSGKLVLTLAISSLVTVSSGIFYTTSAATVVMESCGTCFNNAGGDAHAFGWIMWAYDSFNADCEDFNSCHGNSQSGSCSDFHWQCGGASALAEQVRDAVTRNDLAFIKTTQKKYPGRVVLNAATGLVTIVDCDKTAFRITIPQHVLAQST